MVNLYFIYDIIFIQPNLIHKHSYLNVFINIIIRYICNKYIYIYTVTDSRKNVFIDMSYSFYSRFCVSQIQLFWLVDFKKSQIQLKTSQILVYDIIKIVNDPSYKHVLKLQQQKAFLKKWTFSRVQRHSLLSKKA